MARAGGTFDGYEKCIWGFGVECGDLKERDHWPDQSVKVSEALNRS